VVVGESGSSVGVFRSLEVVVIKVEEIGWDDIL